MTDVVAQWLQRVLGPYRHRDVAFAQATALLRAYPSLSPRTDVFTFDDGRTALLLCVSGTVGVAFRGATYNIPIAVWAPHDFPQEAPICFVVPTADMIVRKGQQVEPSGRCVGGYLDAWQSKPEGCSLVELVQSLQDVFSKEPPLYSKPKSAPSRPSTISPESSPGPSRPQAPPRPPPPPSARSVSQPIPNGASPVRSGSVGPPALPPLPPGHQPRRMQSPHRVVSSPYQERSPPPPIYQPQMGPPHARTYPPHQHPVQHPPPPPLPRPQPPPQPAPIAIAPSNYLDDVEPDPRPDISRTPAPPRPPHPALLALRQAVWVRLSTSFDQLSTSLASEHSNLVALQHDLLRGEPALLDEIGRLEAVRDVCVGVAGRYREASDLAEGRSLDLERKGEPDPDEMVCSTTVLYNQLLDLYAEDQALEDTLYHLGRALNTNAANLDIDRFLKRVRAVGREQFLVRCQVNRILFDLAVEGKPATHR